MAAEMLEFQRGVLQQILGTQQPVVKPQLQAEMEAQVKAKVNLRLRSEYPSTPRRILSQTDTKCYKFFSNFVTRFNTAHFGSAIINIPLLYLIVDNLITV